MNYFKKADSQMFWIIILALVAIVVGILIIVFSKGGIEKAFGGVNEKLDSLGDYDEDGIANMFDRCPCTSAGDKGNEYLQGCAAGTTSEQASVDQQKFKDNACVG